MTTRAEIQQRLKRPSQGVTAVDHHEFPCKSWEKNPPEEATGGIIARSKTDKKTGARGKFNQVCAKNHEFARVNKVKWGLIGPPGTPTQLRSDKQTHKTEEDSELG
jgi:hypothetical protein